MGILLKYVLKNMKEKKFRLFLIMISIVLSSALFFATTAISENVAQIYGKQMRQYSGDSDLSVTKSNDARSSSFALRELDTLSNNGTYQIGIYFANGTYQTEDSQEKRLVLFGAELDDLAQYNPIYMSQTLDSDTFSGKSLIISDSFATENDVGLGDIIELRLGNGVDYKWQVWGIASPKGVLQDTGFQSTFIVPPQTISRLYGEPGKVNQAYVGLKEATNEEGITIYTSELKDFDVEESLPERDLREAIAQIATIFQIMLVLVIFISVYIIYSSFKVMMAERLPVIGTFRSIGATKLSTNIIMLSESFVYGTLGGVLGTFLGIGVLKLMTDQMAYDPYSGVKMDFALQFSTVHVVTTIGMALGLAMISSVIPIIQASKMPIKDIVLDKNSQVKDRTRMPTIIGGTMLILSVAIPVTGFFARSMIVNLGCMIMSIISMVLLLPIITDGFIKLFEKLYVVFGNNGVLAVKNLKGNKSVQGNIILLTIGISSLIMINIISYSVGVEVVDVYGDGKFEIWSWINEMDREGLSKVRSVEGVEDAFGVYSTRDVTLIGKDGELGTLQGIDARKYFDYWDYDLIGDEENIIKTLDQGRYIILNKSIVDKYQYEVGGNVVMELDGRERVYKLIGMTNTLMNNGQMGYISDKYYKNDLDERYYNDVYIRTDIEPELANDNVQSTFVRRGVWSETKAYLEKSNQESNDQLFVMLQGFSLLTMIIGVFGVFNNYLVSMLHRKRSLAMYRSVGMSKKQMRRMLYIESLTCGAIGGITGVIGGLLFVFMVGYMMKAMNLPVAMHINYALLLQSMIGGILVSILASISPVIQSSKMSIIQAVKYE